MTDHIKIMLLTILISTLLAPLISATYIGVLSGQPFIIIYPAVIPIALLIGGPFALLGGIIFVFVGIKKIHNQSKIQNLQKWMTSFLSLGIIYGFISAILLWLLVDSGDNTNLLVGLSYLVPNLVITSAIVSMILAKIWHSYYVKRTA